MWRNGQCEHPYAHGTRTKTKINLTECRMHHGDGSESRFFHPFFYLFVGIILFFILIKRFSINSTVTIYLFFHTFVALSHDASLLFTICEEKKNKWS